MKGDKQHLVENYVKMKVRFKNSPTEEYRLIFSLKNLGYSSKSQYHCHLFANYYFFLNV